MKLSKITVGVAALSAWLGMAGLKSDVLANDPPSITQLKQGGGTMNSCTHKCSVTPIATFTVLNGSVGWGCCHFLAWCTFTADATPAGMSPSSIGGIVNNAGQIEGTGSFTFASAGTYHATISAACTYADNNDAFAHMKKQTATLTFRID
jgi:hypothetical protein